MNREHLDPIDKMIGDCQQLMSALHVLACELATIAVDRPNDRRVRSGTIGVIDALGTKVEEIGEAFADLYPLLKEESA